MSEVRVRPARRVDAALIYGFVRQLAEYEQLSHAVRAAEADITGLLFGPQPRAACEIAEIGGQPVGFALWFYNVSTFAGRAGIYIEDLFVIPEARGRGAGKALLSALAHRCVEEGLGRMEWAVLDWNAPAIAFYDRAGAQSLDDWTVRRVSGQALVTLAGG
jgi:GNAT superfamily N-acetyltransferase